MKGARVKRPSKKVYRFVQALGVNWVSFGAPKTVGTKGPLGLMIFKGCLEVPIALPEQAYLRTTYRV